MRQDKQKEAAPQNSVTFADSEEWIPDVQITEVTEGRQSEERLIATPNSEGRHPATFGAWLQHLPGLSASLVLENSGSIARDHLASERTFLSYVRTSLGCAAVGVALVQIIATTRDAPIRFGRFGKVLGAMTEILSAGIMIIGVARYFTMQKALINGMFPPAGMAIWTLVFFVSVMTIITFGLAVALALG